MLKIHICSVNVSFQDTPADLRHVSFIYISCFSRPQFEKTGIENLECSITLPVYFMVLNFDYGIQNYQLYTFLNIVLCLELFIHRLRFYKVGARNRVSPGYASSGDILYRDTGPWLAGV